MPCMNCFHLIFPCAKIFFVLRPPYKFSNDPSLSLSYSGPMSFPLLRESIRNFVTKALGFFTCKSIFKFLFSPFLQPFFFIFSYSPDVLTSFFIERTNFLRGLSSGRFDKSTPITGMLLREIASSSSIE